MSDGTEQPEDDLQRRHSPGALIVALVLVLYPLSVGPVIGIADRLFRISPADPAGKVITAIYFPIVWLAERSSVFKHLFTWYLHLFGVR